MAAVRLWAIEEEIEGEGWVVTEEEIEEGMDTPPASVVAMMDRRLVVVVRQQADMDTATVVLLVMVGHRGEREKADIIITITRRCHLRHLIITIRIIWAVAVVVVTIPTTRRHHVVDQGKAWTMT